MAQALNALPFHEVHKDQSDYCAREGGLPLFRKQSPWSNLTKFTHDLNSRSSLSKLFFSPREAKANRDLSNTLKIKTDSSYVVLWVPLKKFTGETMFLDLELSTHRKWSLDRGLGFSFMGCSWKSLVVDKYRKPFHFF